MVALLVGGLLPRLLAHLAPLPHGDVGRLPRHHVSHHPLHLPACHGGGPRHQRPGCCVSNICSRHIQHGEDILDHLCFFATQDRPLFLNHSFYLSDPSIPHSRLHLAKMQIKEMPVLIIKQKEVLAIKDNYSLAGREGSGRASLRSGTTSSHDNHPLGHHGG